MTVATKFDIGNFVCFFNTDKGKLEFGTIRTIEIYQNKANKMPTINYSIIPKDDKENSIFGIRVPEKSVFVNREEATAKIFFT